MHSRLDSAIAEVSQHLQSPLTAEEIRLLLLAEVFLSEDHGTHSDKRFCSHGGSTRVVA
jgi:hypothetical protein